MLWGVLSVYLFWKLTDVAFSVTAGYLQIWDIDRWFTQGMVVFKSNDVLFISIC